MKKSMKEEKLLKLMQVMNKSHWIFKGVVTTDELPVNDTSKTYYKNYYGDKFLLFKRIYSYKDESDDFFKRQYEERFISLGSDIDESKDCFKQIDNDWHIPGPDCEWDEEYHITKRNLYGISGCLSITCERLETEQSWKNIADVLNEDCCIFYN